MAAIKMGITKRVYQRYCGIEECPWRMKYNVERTLPKPSRNVIPNPYSKWVFLSYLLEGIP